VEESKLHFRVHVGGPVFSGQVQRSSVCGESSGRNVTNTNHL
jgi:hypothetical protein